MRWPAMSEDAKRPSRMVGAGGLEPLTSSVSGRRSNQLSYAPVSVGNSGVNRKEQYNKKAGSAGSEPARLARGGRAFYLTASFSALPAVKRTTRRFGILMGAPVCGLRAVRALRWAVLKVPKPTKVIASPFLSDFVMPSISDSTAAAA